MPAIRFQQVTKRFAMGETHPGISELAAATIRGILGRPTRKRAEAFTALDCVTFEVSQGEALGIIGPNGAGKSTALKLLAGILKPDSGVVECHGRKAALIEVGAGFHGDLTGRENIQLNGVLLGMSRKEIQAKLDSIVAFAGIGRFLDTPVKRYSSGMYARLGFSIAAHVDPRVLLVDEVLSVGDAAFRVRCLDRMRQLVQGGTALVFVTHDLEQMRAMCHRAIVLEHGRATFDGPPSGAIVQYQMAMPQGVVRPPDILNETEPLRIRVRNFVIRDGFGDEALCIRPDHFVRISIELEALHCCDVILELNLRRTDIGENALSFNSARQGNSLTLDSKINHVTLDLPVIPLRGGQYLWNVRIWDAHNGANLVDSGFRYPMMIDDGGRATGCLALPCDWSVRPAPQVVATSVPTSTPFSEFAQADEVEHEDLLVC